MCKFCTNKPLYEVVCIYAWQQHSVYFKIAYKGYRAFSVFADNRKIKEDITNIRYKSIYGSHTHGIT
jgi:hypothetical protein